VITAPFGDNRRYDLVVEVRERFLRVQCKTAVPSAARAASAGPMVAAQLAKRFWRTAAGAREVIADGQHPAGFRSGSSLGLVSASGHGDWLDGGLA